MELYDGDAFDDLVVPKDEEISDRLPSPGSWSKWGVMAPQGIVFPSYNKQGAEADDTSMFEDESWSIEEFLSNECSDSRKRLLDGLAAASLGSSEDSLGRMDDYLKGIGQMDDSFMNSLLEGLPLNHSAPGSFFVPPSSDSCGMPADYLCSNMDVDSQNFPSDAHAVGRGRYIKKHAVSPSSSLEGRQVPASHSTSSKLQNKDCPQSEVQISFLSERSTEDGHADEVSVEKSVLQELETVLGQLTSNTRIRFRDALYRLAQNSREQGMLQDHQESEQSMKNALCSSAGKETLESETNPIDRAVATLMFNKKDVNVRDFPVPASICCTFAFSDSSNAVNFRASNQARGDSLERYAGLRVGVEVPIFGLVTQQMAS